MGTKDKLVEIVRKATGRQLTQKNIERAKEGYKYDAFDHMSERRRRHSTLGDSASELSLAMKDGEIILKEVGYEYAKTPDVSHGNSIMHWGWYHVSFEQRAYTPDGLLKSKAISKNQPMDSTYFHKEVKYDPPGTLIGETVKKVRNWW